MRRCTSLLAFAGFFMIPGILLADHRDQADAATCRLHDAEARLRAVQCEIDRARAALDCAISNRSAALGQYDQVARLANASSVCISDAQSKLDRATTAARDWAARADECRAVFDEAKT